MWCPSALLRKCGICFICGIFVALTSAQVAPDVAGSISNSPQLRGMAKNIKHKKSRFFLWLSDIHADPYYGTNDQQCSKNESATSNNEFGTIGCDPPYSLLKSAVTAAADLQAEFVLFTGDFTRHDQSKLINPSENVSDIIANVSQIISSGFPAMVASDAFVMGALGNDDSPEDYELNITTWQASNSWLDLVGGVLANVSVMSHNVHREYDYGGFFNVTIGGTEILSIDTVIYSMWHTPAASPLQDDPFKQFAWLRQRLEAATAEKRSVWIIGHIPPGMETYGYTELWHKQYVNAYLSLVEDPILGGCIAAQLFGHVHKEEIRVLPRAPEGAGPVFVMASLSPIYHNNPSFRLVEYDADSGRMLDYSTYYAELPKGKIVPEWKLGYTASLAYKPLQVAKQEGGLTNRAVEKFAAALALGEEEFSTYANWYQTNHSSDLERCTAKFSNGQSELSEEMKTFCVMSYMCAVPITAQNDYQKCKSKFAVRNISEARIEDYQTKDAPKFYEAARQVHWYSIGTNASMPGSGFA